MNTVRPAVASAQLKQSLLCWLQLPESSCVWVALSGGMDSTLLASLVAEALSELERPIRFRCVHVNHRVNPDAGHWAERCVEFCARLGLACDVITISGRAGTGVSPEAWLREQRYQCLASVLASTDVMMTAHHQDDQAETFLLQALRGAGPRGLASMPLEAPLGQGRLVRPWLKYPIEALQATASERGLEWIEDPGNEDSRFDRNFIRNRILPLLKQRWPTVTRQLARAASWQQEGLSLVEDVLHEAYVQACATQDALSPPALSVSRVIGCAAPLQRLVLRRWIEMQGLAPPDHRHVAELQKLLQASVDRPGSVRWGTVCVRRYRDQLQVFSNETSSTGSVSHGEWRWRPPGHCDLGFGVLEALPGTGSGLHYVPGETEFRVCLRAGGESLKPTGSPHRRTLKRLLQERAIAPWDRGCLPLIYLGETLVAVADLWIAEGSAARGNEPGLILNWKRTRPQS